MAGDDLRKVTRGTPLKIPAAAYNSFLEAAADLRNRRLGNKPGSVPHDTRPGILYVRNDSGEHLGQFGVLGLNGIVISPTDNEREFRSRLVMSGVTPSKASHRGRFCVLAEPIKQGRIGRAYVDSFCPVRLNVQGEQQEPRFAEIKDGSTEHLTASVFGSASILWREGGTGEQWAVVRFGRTPSVFPVKLVKTGGSQGNASNPATWTYDVLDPVTGEMIEAAVAPVSSPHNWKRPSIGWMIEATAGTAHFAGNGTLVLDWINETVDQEPCGEDE